MKRFLCLSLLTLLFVSCHESLEERAEREAREYTERNCPTPVVNFSRTDSVRFDREARNYIYYCSFAYIVRSDKQPSKVLYRDTIKVKRDK